MKKDPDNFKGEQKNAIITQENFVLSHINDTWPNIVSALNEAGFRNKDGDLWNLDSIRKWCDRREIRKSPRLGGAMRKQRSVEQDVELHRLKKGHKDEKKRHQEYLNRIAELEEELSAFEAIKPISTHAIRPKLGKSKNEGTVVVIASDWHIEERVDPETVNGKNEHNLAIAQERATEFFQAVLRLTQILARDVHINEMVLALLGDFITGDIHDEMLETAEVEPTRAIIIAQNIIASGIQFLLDNSKLTFTIPCHSGNHARTTREQRIATEAGHSLEYVMYHFLADHFRGNKRVKFLIPRSYHSFVEVYNLTIRFHHGHNIRYGGGVGGLTIPVNKAIAQWNKARWADIDCFGHWHTQFDGGNFIANGSSIGYNAYGVSIKAPYDRPKQTLFLIDKKRGRTCLWNIVFSQ